MSLLLRPRTGAHEGLWSRLDQRGRVVVVLGVAAAVAFMGSQGATLARALVGLFGLLVLVMIVFASRDTAIAMVVVWLIFMGFVRRFLIPFAGWSEQDPLLMVGPAAAVTFLLAARRSGVERTHNLLSGLAAFLMLWSLMQVFNPNETSIVVGLQGAMFVVVPMLWFFVGRTLTDRQHDRIHEAVFWAAIIVTAHGLYQTFFSLLPFEFTWLNESSQGGAIFVGGFKPRPFSTLTSPQEYGQFMSFAGLIIWARILYPKPGFTRRHRGWMVVYFVTVLVANFYQGGRANFAFFMLAIAVTTMVRLRNPAILLLAAVFAGMFLTWVGGQSVADEGTVQEAKVSGALARHQLSGFTDPSSSTLPEHLSRIQEAVGQGVTDPFGVGVSQESIAGVKAGNEASLEGSAENDIAHTLQSLGAPAGFAYIAFIFSAYAAAIRMQRRAPSARHLVMLGMLVAATTQVWAGPLYCTSTLMFLGLGGLARESGDLKRAEEVMRYRRVREASMAAGERARARAAVDA